MTASSPVTMADLVSGLKLIAGSTECGVVHNVEQNRYELSDGADNLNEVMLSVDGLTITFGSFTAGGPEFTGFTFNA